MICYVSLANTIRIAHQLGKNLDTIFLCTPAGPRQLNHAPTGQTTLKIYLCTSVGPTPLNYAPTGQNFVIIYLCTSVGPTQLNDAPTGQTFCHNLLMHINFNFLCNFNYLAYQFQFFLNFFISIFGFLIAISLFYEKLSPNSLIFSFYMFATYVWKKNFKMVAKCHVTTPYLESGRWKLGLLSHFFQ